MKCVLLLALVAAIFCGEYSGHRLVKLDLSQTRHHALFDKVFHDSVDVFSNDGVLVQGVNEVRLNPKQFALLTQLNLNFEILEADLQVGIDEEAQYHKIFSAVFKNGEEYFKAYHKLEEHTKFESDLAEKYPNMMEKIEIGNTIEGRPQIVYKIKAPGMTTLAAKPAFFITGATHCREWISTAVVQYIINKLVTTYESDPEVKTLLDSMDVYALSLVNKDGYVKTWGGSRLWRKNTRGGYGVDLNRNFKSGFGGSGSSGSKYSEVYRGTHAYSEPEVENQIKFFKAHPEIKGVIDFHSYSQLILRPLGRTTKKCPHENQFKAVGAEMAAAIKATHGENYSNIRSSELYVASGISTDDWYESGGLQTVSFCIELRPKGGTGFQLPAKFILPTSEESFKAFVAASKHIH